MIYGAYYSTILKKNLLRVVYNGHTNLHSMSNVPGFSVSLSTYFLYSLIIIILIEILKGDIVIAISCSLINHAKHFSYASLLLLSFFFDKCPFRFTDYLLTTYLFDFFLLCFACALSGV